MSDVERPAPGAEVIVTDLKRRHTGVSATVAALVPIQLRRHRVAHVGPNAIAGLPALSLAAAVSASRRPPAGRPHAIWHVRRNLEMAIALAVRDILRLPIRIVFTSAAQRRHSLLPRLLIARMDAIIATTQAAATFVPRVAAVIGHGVDTERFQPPTDKATAWAETGIPGRYGIGTFGRVRPEKGTDLFVEAMCRLLPEFADFTAFVAGQTRPEHAGFRARLDARIAEAGLGARIRFLGEVPAPEIERWYRAALMVVQPPRYEGYGLTVIEAMASGAAVVASRTGAFGTMIEDGVTGAVVPAGDVEATIAALRPLLAAPGRMIAMGASGAFCG